MLILMLIPALVLVMVQPGLKSGRRRTFYNPATMMSFQVHEQPSARKRFQRIY
jgi:hypothetical protein